MNTFLFYQVHNDSFYFFKKVKKVIQDLVGGSKLKVSKNTALVTATAQTFWAFCFEAGGGPGSSVSANVLLMGLENRAMLLTNAAQSLPLAKGE